MRGNNMWQYLLFWYVVAGLLFSLLIYLNI